MAGPHRASRCPGCGLELPDVDTPGHPYLGASSACWSLYGSALARAYSEPACHGVRQLVVDAYSCQHPGERGRRSAQSIGLHLMTLCLVFEQGADPRHGPDLHRRMVDRPQFTWLQPPAERGRLTVESLNEPATADSYIEAAWAWAWETWWSWRRHHATVRGWLARALA